MNAPFADFSRREALSTLAVAAAGLAATPALAALAGNKPQPAGTTKPASAQPATPPAAPAAPTGPLVLPPLPYDKAALEPSIDAETMEIHHDRHHKAYVDNANKALAGTKWADASPGTIMREIIGGLADIEDPKLRATLRNNVGGHVNHTMFWMTMAPAGKGGGGEPTGALADALSAFGSFAGEGGFKEKFAAAGTSRFGSGWAWLVVTADKKLAICSTANQDNPLMGDKIAGCGGTPILGLDVWEHAYYLKYRNLRAGYIKAWWDVVNWSAVSGLYTAAMKKG